MIEHFNSFRAQGHPIRASFGSRERAGWAAGWLGLPRDWSQAEDWHRGYLLGKLAMRRISGAVVTGMGRR